MVKRTKAYRGRRTAEARETQAEIFSKSPKKRGRQLIKKAVSSNRPWAIVFDSSKPAPLQKYVAKRVDLESVKNFT